MTVVKVLAVAVAVLACGAFGDASARPKKHSARPTLPPAVIYDEHGTPIIMKGYRAPSRTRSMAEPKQHAEQPPKVRRGSSTYIPPPVPSPAAANSPPAAGALQPGPGVYQPPPINSFSDRVINCIHSAPLNAGVGNNPSDPQSYIRACAN